MNADNFSLNLKKHMQSLLIRRSDIPYYNQNNIVDIITGVLDKYTDANTNDINVENAIKNIKEILDKTFGTGWICLIGESFSFNISAKENSFLFCFYQGYLAIVVYKC
ncbi:dynein light chain, putative [Plasmodium malariae]|uniref:Dynein light chain, putative n=1 Tax=Plasmodium malariae TaxID=5858 RepID=A0A1C3KAT6_PLAMA|nr:dynein light chain, putative [Plasmodium malariae]SBT70656.1 dynein light chain, putative [Plasmodium malariae]SBT86585.1 dynein light chain, putative [Plasmodium malariae]